MLRLDEQGTELTSLGLQGKWFIHYVKAAPNSAVVT